MSYVDEHIRERLDGFYETNYENVSDCFVYQFGPYMAMCPGYENEVDQISKHNQVMRFIQTAAYILRGTAAKTDKKAVRDFLRQTLLEVDKEFPKEQFPEERESLLKLIESQLNRTFSPTNGNESVMTDVAPVVPYEQELEKPDIFVQEAQAAEHVRLFMESNGDVRATLHHLLLNNVEDILRNPMVDEFSPDVLRNLHNFVTFVATRETRVPALYAVKSDNYRYSLLAALYYHNPSNEFLDSVLRFYDGIMNPIEEYDVFEALINDTIQHSTPALESSWEDPGLEETDEETVNAMLSDVISPRVQDSNPDFNLTALLNFVALNRYMQFDVFCNRRFIDEFKVDTTENPSQIVNINRLGENRNAYELSTGILVMPYLDLRDYRVRYIHLKKNSDKPYISGRIHEYQ